MKALIHCTIPTAINLFLVLQIQAQELKTVFDFGKQKGWASAFQEKKLNTYLATWTPADEAKFVRFLNQAKTRSARFFVLESWLAGDETKILQKFINELNAYPEDYQQQQCYAGSASSIIQQWQNTCSITVCQTYLADICPRYAWDVKKLPNFQALANDPSHPMAAQQKMLIEHYGGTVSKRGDESGLNIGINNPLNEWVGLPLGVKFSPHAISQDLSLWVHLFRKQLDDGLNVPLLVGFKDGGTNHFILLMGYQIKNGTYHYLIYDPWDGVCNYVSESNLLRGSLAPLNNTWSIEVKYYYPAVVMTERELQEAYEKRNNGFGIKE